MQPEVDSKCLINDERLLLTHFKIN